MSVWPDATGTAALPWIRVRHGALPAWWAQMEPRPESAADASKREGALPAQAQAGHREAFDRLVELYAGRIYTHLYRMVRNRQEAEDLTQETFIRAYRFIHQYDDERPFRNWLYGIATRIGLNALRSRRRRERHEAPDTDAADHSDALPAAANPRKHAARKELRERLVEAMATLPPTTATLMHLFYFEGMSVREAAEISGMTEAAAKVALHRARKRMRELLVDDDE